MCMFKKTQLLILLLLGTVAVPAFGMESETQEELKNQFLKLFTPTRLPYKKKGMVNVYKSEDVCNALPKQSLILVTTDEKKTFEEACNIVSKDDNKGTFIVYTTDSKKNTNYFPVTLEKLTVKNFFEQAHTNNKLKYCKAKAVICLLQYAKLKLTATLVNSENVALNENEHLVYNKITKCYYVVTIADSDKNCFSENVRALSQIGNNKYSEASINELIKGTE